MITQEQLKQLLPKNPYISHWHKALEQLFPDYEINTPQRMASFIAQCAHESAGFTALVENLNYRWQSLRKVFPKYFPDDAIAQDYASRPNKQEAIANRIYASRSNYTWFAASLEISPEEASEYLTTFEGAAQSACWFWESNKLNQWADKGDILTLTKRINGGTIGLDDRIKHYEHALHVLGTH
jgi:putative chitinase